MSSRVTFAATVVVLAVLFVFFARSCREWFTGFSTQRWGCPPGLIEFEKGCYDPKTRVYTSGKKIVTDNLARRIDATQEDEDVIADVY